MTSGDREILTAYAEHVRNACSVLIVEHGVLSPTTGLTTWWWTIRDNERHLVSLYWAGEVVAYSTAKGMMAGARVFGSAAENARTFSPLDPESFAKLAESIKPLVGRQ